MTQPITEPVAQPIQRSLWRSLLRLARPKQWAKCGFVLIGPLYGYADGKPVDWLGAAAAAVAFGLAASACYVFNDIRDRDADRLHPRKRRRPIASGAVPVATARAFGASLFVLAAIMLVLVPASSVAAFSVPLGLYIVNVLAYSASLKHVVILDVISLAGGFVLRVVGGCVATGIEPSPWLLNCTFFLAMFLSLGKRLGERRTMQAAGADVASIRGVQAVYTDDLLRMLVVVTAVATLITYAGYVEDRAAMFGAAHLAAPSSAPAIEPPSFMHWLSRHRFYLMWLTMLPATYGLLRCIVMLERGAYDDPTELAAGDRPVQAAVLLFGCLTLAITLLS
ncbi:MAG: UbiA prenyltransferase family protein [Phycisphaerales bacterium]